MNRPLYAKIIGTISVLIILLGVAIAVTTRAGVVAAAPSTYSLKFSGYDFDGQNEITLALNNVTIGQFPAIFNTANAAKYVSFFFGPLTIISGANTLKFTHSSLDLGVPDYVKNLTITASTGSMFYSNNTILATVPGPLVYSFGAPTAPPPAPPAPPVGSTGTGTVAGTFRLSLAPANFTMTNLAWNQSQTVYLNLTNTGVTLASLNYTLNLGTLPGGSVLHLGSCGQAPIGTLKKTTIIGNRTYTNPCVQDPRGMALLLSLSAGYMDMLALTVTPGPTVVTGSTYSFGVSIRGR